MAMEDKISNFIWALNTHIDNRAEDAKPTEGFDSGLGMTSMASEEELRKSLYALFNVSEG